MPPVFWRRTVLIDRRSISTMCWNRIIGRSSAVSVRASIFAPSADFFRRVLICLWHKTSPLGRIATATNSLIKCGGKQALKRAVKQFYLPFFGVLTSSNRHILFDFCRFYPQFGANDRVLRFFRKTRRPFRFDPLARR